jgi:hypothetical protein
MGMGAATGDIGPPISNSSGGHSNITISAPNNDPAGAQGSGMGQSAGLANSSSSAISSSATLAPRDSDLLPGEEYQYLQACHVSFPLDFFETFTAMCDTLIDFYVLLLKMVAGPEKCGPGLGEMFTKADGKMRKLVLVGVVKDLEEGARQVVRSQTAGLGRLIMEGLM